MFLGKEHKNAMVVSAILFMLFVIRRIVCINSLYIIWIVLDKDKELVFTGGYSL